MPLGRFGLDISAVFDEKAYLAKLTFLCSMKRSTFRSAFFSRRVLIPLLLCAAGGSSIVSGTLLAFFYPEAPTKDAKRTLTLEERVAYQRAIEEVYWRHRIWPKEQPWSEAIARCGDISDSVGKESDEIICANHRRWSITGNDQLLLSSCRLNWIAWRNTPSSQTCCANCFEALGNDPFVIAECLARPALAERLLTNWYAHDQRIHGDLRQRAEADLRAHATLEQMKHLTGNYSEIELIRSDSAQTWVYRAGERGVKLNSRGVGRHHSKNNGHVQPPQLSRQAGLPDPS